MTGPRVTTIPEGIWCGSAFPPYLVKPVIWSEFDVKASFSYGIVVTANLLCPKVLGSQSCESRGFWVPGLGITFPTCLKLQISILLLVESLPQKFTFKMLIFKVHETSYRLLWLLYILSDYPSLLSTFPTSNGTYLYGWKRNSPDLSFCNIWTKFFLQNIS